MGRESRQSQGRWLEKRFGARRRSRGRRWRAHPRLSFSGRPERRHASWRAAARPRPGAPITVGGCRRFCTSTIWSLVVNTVSNAARIRGHREAFAAKPVGLLTAAELARWRDALLAGKLERSSVRRTCRCLAAALSLASKRDPRIKNADAWRHGLGGISGASGGTRNAQVLSDPQVHALIAAAYAEGASSVLHRSRGRNRREAVANRQAQLSPICKTAASRALMMPSEQKRTAASARSRTSRCRSPPTWRPSSRRRRRARSGCAVVAARRWPALAEPTTRRPPGPLSQGRDRRRGDRRRQAGQRIQLEAFQYRPNVARQGAGASCRERA